MAHPPSPGRTSVAPPPLPPPSPSPPAPSRPQLSLSTSTVLQAHPSHHESSPHEADRPAQLPTEQPFSPLALSSSSTVTSLSPGPPQQEHGQAHTPRSVSHGRSYSMSEGHSSASGGAAAAAGAGLGAGGVMGEGPAASAPGVPSAAAAGGIGAALARRNNTVSTASSRLVRLERNRARIALQGVGLSEEDQEFYVPPSPIRGGPYANVPWSDVGHGAPADLDAVLPLVVSPTGSTFDRSSAGGGSAHSRATSTSSDVAAAAWTKAGQSNGAGAVGGQGAATQAAAAAEPKRSSFVVLRGGKGDSALMERRPANAVQHTSPPAPATSSGPPPSAYPATPTTSFASAAIAAPEGSTQLRHKNSLKPFLEQEREEREQGGRAVEEDWERGLIDERKSGADGGAEGEALNIGHAWMNTDPYATLTTPPLSSSFPSSLSSPFGPTSSHYRASTYHAHPSRHASSTDPWRSSAGTSATSPGFVEDSSIRRHQSLSSFRPRDPTESLSGALSTSPASTTLSSSEAPLERAHSLSHAPRPLGSLALGSASTIAGFGSRSRAGTSPAPLSLHHSHSLGHGPPLATTAGQRSAGLSHSNSLGSRSNAACAAERGALSPAFPGAVVPGIKSPWSPTEEETKQLGMSAIGSASSGGGSLSRGGSGSSKGSHQGHAQAQGFAEEVRRLGEEMSGMQLGYSGGVARMSPSPQPSAPSPSQPSTGGAGVRSRLPPLMTNPDLLASLNNPGAGLPPGAQAFLARQGPASAAAFVPPIGHSHQPFARFNGAGGMDGISEYPPSPAPAMAATNGFASAAIQVQQQQQHYNGFALSGLQSSTIATAAPSSFSYDLSPHLPARSLHPQHVSAFPGGPSSSDWLRQKELLLGSTAASASGATLGPLSASTVTPASLPFSCASAASAVAPGAGGTDWSPGFAAMQQQQAQIQVLQSQMAQALSAMDAMRAQGAVVPAGFDLSGMRGPGGAAAAAQGEDVAETPLDVNGLVQKKGYNPAVFDLRPKNARFFVIKSYTEEDVHKSLKYEIWASTDLGNKRLDRAFKESADKGPIYLFFSVNASGHFAGLAQMLTPVDYSLSSNVWASDKWKGVLKVRWIYIKDVPLNALRHIRLSNTPENKPVTSSRDTQEVPYEAGLEVLRIIATYQSRTSLLQDFAWYDAQHRHGGGPEGGKDDETKPPHQPHYAPRNQQQAPTSYSPSPPPQGGYPLAPPPQPPSQRFSPSPPPPPPMQQPQQQHRPFWRGGAAPAGPGRPGGGGGRGPAPPMDNVGGYGVAF
ncbi:hypothetical protein JCM1841_006636 [Sporobolomyces salmonicolor]